MTYQHSFLDGVATGLPVGKAVCVARNYAAHARELGNVVPESPVLFIKPSTALVGLEQPIRLPAHSSDVHHETELAVLIGQTLCRASPQQAAAAVAGYALGLDLTARDVQKINKERGYPWELAKAFDGSCPLSPFVAPEQIPDPQVVTLRLWVNGELRQDGCARDMVTPVFELVAYASRFFTLLPGDVVLTGTPEGVARLAPGDRLRAELDGRWRFETRVASD